MNIKPLKALAYARNNEFKNFAEMLCRIDGCIETDVARDENVAYPAVDVAELFALLFEKLRESREL